MVPNHQEGYIYYPQGWPNIPPQGPWYPQNPQNPQNPPGGSQGTGQQRPPQ